MKCRPTLFILCLILIFLICTGCDNFHNAIFEEENVDIPEEEYMAERFFVKEVDGPMSDSFILCYEHWDGEITEIVDLGMEQCNYMIVENRIYYVNGSTLTSIGFDGQDRQTFHDEGCEVEPRGVLYH